MRTKEIISRPDLLKIGLKEKLPVDFLKQLVDIQASFIWNVPFIPGKEFPVLDEHGNLFAYVFPLFEKSERYPEREELYEFVSEYREEFVEFKAEDVDEDVEFIPVSEYRYWLDKEFTSKFRKQFKFLGSVYVSATKKNFPILKFTKAIHPLFLTRDEAYHKAEKFLETKDVKLENIYFFGPEGEYYEFATEYRKILMHPFTLEIIEHKDVLDTINTVIKLPELEKEVEMAWDKMIEMLYEEPLRTFANFKFIPDYEMIPVFNKTYWSAPTAWTMALGYFDNYVQGKYPKLGYGRLIDFWYYNKESKTMVPNLIDKLLNEDIGTGLTDLETTVNNTCGYDFDIHHYTVGTPLNEYGWRKLKEVINAGRPALWYSKFLAEMPEGDRDHVKLVFGYGNLGLQKMVFSLNTFGPTFMDQFECLPFDQWRGNEEAMIKIGYFRPGGGIKGSKLFLQYPKGGEEFKLKEDIPIKWEAIGGLFRTVDLFYSIDNGLSWKKIRKDIVSKPGLNTFFWKPDKVSDTYMIRIMGYGRYLEKVGLDELRKPDFEEFYIAGDGMKYNFKVVK